MMWESDTIALDRNHGLSSITVVCLLGKICSTGLGLLCLEHGVISIVSYCLDPSLAY